MERDLSYVGKDMKVVVSLHIPTTLREWDRTGYNFNYSQIADVMCNRKAVDDSAAPYDALILSGHTHTGNNEIITETLMEQNVTSLGGACGRGPLAWTVVLPVSSCIVSTVLMCDGVFLDVTLRMIIR